MKQLCLAIAALFLFISCNNNNQKSDSVEIADSMNKAKIDSDLNNVDVNTPPVIKTDKESTLFLVNALNGGMAEIKLGQLAQQKAANEQVKNFAAMMIRDHTAGNNEITTLAKARNVTLPGSHGDEKQKIIDDLNTRKGTDFDRRFMRIMVMEHETAIGLFQNATDVVNDVEVKRFIDNTLPKLRTHLDSAKAVSKLVN